MQCEVRLQTWPSNIDKFGQLGVIGQNLFFRTGLYPAVDRYRFLMCKCYNNCKSVDRLT